jgi:hypothetical protein
MRPKKGDRVLVIFVTNFSVSYPHETLYTIVHELAHVLLGHYEKTKWRGEKARRGPICRSSSGDSKES